MTTPLEPVIAALRSAGCVFAEAEARLLVEAAAGPDELAELVARRSRGEPLEYVVGWAEFCGLRIAVEPGVFVPRRRSEFLVDLAVERATAAARARSAVTAGERRAAATHGLAAGARGLAAGARGPTVGAAIGDLPGTTPAGSGQLGPGGRLTVVDLCCGSGALGAAIASRLPGAEVHAADLDPVAVRCARRNLPRVHRGDLFDALPARLRGRIDLLVTVTPYVPTGDIRLLPPEARDHEPRTALDGGPDGLALLRRLVPRTPGWLAPGGTFLTETSETQAPLAAALLTEHGLRPTIEQLTSAEEEVVATVVTARSPAP